jgi:dTDP-4-dehydrorhamnose reductase
VTGASGQLGSVLVRQLASTGDRVVALSGSRAARIGDVVTRPVDLTDHDAIQDLLEQTRPTVIAHLAAVSSVAEALEDPQRTQRVNVDATVSLVEQARRIGARFIYASSDLVFDGTAPPYDESSRPAPLSCYGRSKLQAEPAVLDHADGVVVRPSLMFGLGAVHRPTTFARQLAALRDGLALRLFQDEFRTALWLEDAAQVIASIGRSDFVGLVHLAGPVRISRFEMGLAMAEALGLRTDAIQAVSASSMSFPEPRPADVSLDGGLLRRTFPDLPPPLTVRRATARISPAELARLPAVE